MKILKIAGMFLLALLIMVVTQGIASIFSDLIPGRYFTRDFIYHFCFFSRSIIH